MRPIIEVRNLTKRYGDLIAVNDISFAVQEGEIFGLLGPNGAGKTTTLEMIEGLRRPDGGEAIVDGLNVTERPRSVRARIGVQLQSAGFFEKLTVEETLRLFGTYHRRSVPVEPLMRRLELLDKRRALVEELSGGQRQRVSIALALLNDPRIVFLDEPTTGLDPQARRMLWGEIEGIRAEGRTLILTTHYMEEAQQLCDRVAIMDAGRVVALDAPRSLITTHVPETTVTVAVEAGHVDFAALAGVREVVHHNGEVRLLTREPQQTLNALLEFGRTSGLRYHGLRVEESTLEDVFLRLTGKRLRE